ncbi:MAG: hypothetical protein ACR2GA_03405 [Chloroflexota bacterium]
MSSLKEIGPITFMALLAGGLALWVGLVVWTFADIRSRSRDTMAWLAATLLVVVLNVVGFVLYLALRPRPTLLEACERRLNPVESR